MSSEIYTKIDFTDYELQQYFLDLKKLTNKIPFRIRGHRLLKLGRIYVSCLSNDNPYLTIRNERRLRWEQSIFEEQDYKQDTQGTTQQESANYLDSYCAFLAKFLLSKNDTLVHVVVNELDDICEGTTEKRHCKDKCRSIDAMFFNGLVNELSSKGKVVNDGSLRFIVKIGDLRDYLFTSLK